MHHRRAIALALLTGLLLSCTSTTRQGAVGVDRQQFLLVSAKEVNAGAEKAYQKVLEENREKNTLNTDTKMLGRLRTIADRIIPHTRIFREDAPNWKWEVNLIKSDQLNAWCMPGGKIAFYTGIIEKLDLSDDEIAAIMGHEMAHALREHGRERISENIATDAGVQLASTLLGLPATGRDLTSLVTNVTLTLPHSRQHETEADRIGVELAALAGYSPYAAVEVWVKMEKKSSGGTAEVLSTHPSSSRRIADLKIYAARVDPLYQKSRKNKADGS